MSLLARETLIAQNKQQQLGTYRQQLKQAGAELSQTPAPSKSSFQVG